MPNRPGDHIAVSLEIAFAPLVGSEDTCNVSCDGGLFGQDRNGTGFNFFHRNLSLPSSSAECAFEAISKLKLREGTQEQWLHPCSPTCICITSSIYGLMSGAGK